MVPELSLVGMELSDATAVHERADLRVEELEGHVVVGVWPLKERLKDRPVIPRNHTPLV